MAKQVSENCWDNYRIRMRYQPIYSLESHMISGFEALLRASDCNGALHNPGEVISLGLAKDGLESLGSLVIDIVLRDISHWGSVVEPVPVSINVEVPQLCNAPFCDRLRESLDRYRIPATLIKLELTERSIIPDDPVLTKNIEELKNLGVHFSLDDFGTGFGTLTHLVALPVDELKIDARFIRGCHWNPRCQAVVKAVAQMARDMEMRVVAEGVEELEQAKFIEDCGIRFGQGYLFKRPTDTAGVYALLQRSRRNRADLGMKIIEEPVVLC